MTAKNNVKIMSCITAFARNAQIFLDSIILNDTNDQYFYFLLKKYLLT